MNLLWGLFWDGLTAKWFYNVYYDCIAIRFSQFSPGVWSWVWKVYISLVLMMLNFALGFESYVFFRLKQLFKANWSIYACSMYPLIWSYLGWFYEWYIDWYRLCWYLIVMLLFPVLLLLGQKCFVHQFFIRCIWQNCVAQSILGAQKHR